MTKYKRILLRDELFNEFKQIGIINKANQFLRSKLKALNNDLQKKWNIYCMEFRTEEEAIYCISRHDDFENHKCSKCGEICKFDDTIRQKIKYFNTCGKLECTNKHYKINDKDFLQYIKDQYQLRGSKLTVTEISKKFKIGYSTASNYIKEQNLLDYVKINDYRNIHNYDIWSNDEKFTQFIKEQYKERGFLTLSLLKKIFVDNDTLVKNKITKLNLLKYFYIRENDYRHIQHYDIWSDDEKFIQFIKEQYKEKNTKLTLKELSSIFSLTDNTIKSRVRQLNLLDYVYIRKFTQKIISHPDIWNNDENFKQFIKEQYNKKRSLLKVPEIRKYLSVNDDSLREKIKRLNLLEYFYIKPTSKVHIQHYDIWSDDNKLIEFIKEQYNKKGSFLVMTEIASFFNVCPHRVRLKIVKLNLLDYFYIQQSNLEVDFESFLNKCDIQFKRNDKSILYNNNTNDRKEIDFLCGNIGFEINDIATHNSSNKNDYTYKNPLYHQQKSLLAKEKNIELIHIWEWELRNKEIWDKLSKWILNKFNINKIIDISECIIRNIDEKTAKIFSDLYNLSNFKNNNNYIGIYHNEELIQVIIVNLITHQVDIITKFGFSISDKNKLLIQYCNQKLNIHSLYSLCDLSKDNGDEYVRLRFNLIDIIEPNPIWCDKEMKIFNERHSNCVPIYNCGYNKYELVL